MAQGEEADVKRILSACFRGNDTLSSEDIIRILTFELGWMDDEKAEILIASFISRILIFFIGNTIHYQISL